jgi:hypothetical protein
MKENKQNNRTAIIRQRSIRTCSTSSISRQQQKIFKNSFCLYSIIHIRPITTAVGLGHIGIVTNELRRQKMTRLINTHEILNPHRLFKLPPSSKNRQTIPSVEGQFFRIQNSMTRGTDNKPQYRIPHTTRFGPDEKIKRSRYLA